MKKNQLTARVLAKIIDTHDWHQGDLAAKSGITRSLVSAHLAGQRAIRDQHIGGYLRAADHLERQMLLAAWMRDTLPTDLLHELFPKPLNPEGSEEYTFKPEIINWSPKLDEEQREMLNWWADKLLRDPDLDEIFRMITRKAGYDVPSEITALRAADSPTRKYGSKKQKTLVLEETLSPKQLAAQQQPRSPSPSPRKRAPR